MHQLVVMEDARRKVNAVTDLDLVGNIFAQCRLPCDLIGLAGAVRRVTELVDGRLGQRDGLRSELVGAEREARIAEELAAAASAKEQGLLDLARLEGAEKIGV